MDCEDCINVATSIIFHSKLIYVSALSRSMNHRKLQIASVFLLGPWRSRSVKTFSLLIAVQPTHTKFLLTFALLGKRLHVVVWLLECFPINLQGVSVWQPRSAFRRPPTDNPALSRSLAKRHFLGRVQWDVFSDDRMEGALRRRLHTSSFGLNFHCFISIGELAPNSGKAKAGYSRHAGRSKRIGTGLTNISNQYFY